MAVSDQTLIEIVWKDLKRIIHPRRSTNITESKYKKTIKFFVLFVSLGPLHIFLELI